MFKLFTMDHEDCSYCEEREQELTSHNVPFQAFNVHRSRAAMAESDRLGIEGVPALAVEVHGGGTWPEAKQASVEALRWLLPFAVFNPRTGAFSVPEQQARIAGFKPPSEIEHDDEDDDDEDDGVYEVETLTELLDELNLEEQKRVLHDRDFAAPGGKARRTSRIVELLNTHQLRAEDITRPLLRWKLEHLAEVLDVDENCNVTDLRQRVASTITDKFLERQPPAAQQPWSAQRPAAEPRDAMAANEMSAESVAGLLRQYQQLLNMATHPTTPDAERQVAMSAAQKIRARLTAAGRWPADR